MQANRSELGPPTPVAGTSYLIGATPTGEWSQYPDHVAAFTGGGWRFVAPEAGMSVLVKSTEIVAAFGAGGWEMGGLRGSRVIIDGEQVVGVRAAAIPDPAGGATIDSEGRAAIGAILDALRHHGLISS